MHNLVLFAEKKIVFLSAVLRSHMVVVSWSSHIELGTCHPNKSKNTRCMRPWHVVQVRIHRRTRIRMSGNAETKRTCRLTIELSFEIDCIQFMKTRWTCWMQSLMFSFQPQPRFPTVKAEPPIRSVRNLLEAATTRRRPCDLPIQDTLKQVMRLPDADTCS